MFVLGSLGALSFPPVNFTPILWLSFPALILGLQGTANWKQAFVTGWCFTFGLFVFGFYWIAAAMFVDIAHFWWAVPLAIAGLPAAFALYYGLAAMAAWRFGLKGFAGAIGFALFWFLADVARGNLFTGFPWNLEGYAWSGLLPMLQFTSVAGIYGLTLFTLIAACMPALLIDNTKSSRTIVMISLVLLMLIDSWGQARLASAMTATVPDVRLRLVQPNTDQARKWQPENREGIFMHLLGLSDAPGKKPVKYVIWPETAATFYLAEDMIHRARLAPHVPQNGAILTGVIRRDLDPLGTSSYYNSLIAIEDKGEVAAHYDKHHLVPYGEYIPFRALFPIKAVASLGMDFSAGPDLQTLRVDGLPPFSPLICYEAIFSGDVARKDDRPAFLLNITNDGWYGETAGPYQHFAIARVRAIEEGLPLVRAANTGISGVVDAYGRITGELGLGKPGFLDVDLPVSIPPTIFSLAGEKLLWLLFVMLGLWAFYVRYRKK